MILLPAMEDYFIAAEKGSEFIGRLLEEILSILRDPEQVQGKSEKLRFASNSKIDGKDVYNEYFILACQRVLLKKQQ